MNKYRIVPVLLLFCLAAALLAACSGSSSGKAVSRQEAAAVLAEVLGNPHYIYLKFSGFKPDSPLGQAVTGLFENEIYRYEWGDVRKVYVQNKPEAAAYANGDISTYLSGEMAADIAVQKITIEDVESVKKNGNEMTVTFRRKIEPAPLTEAIEKGPRTRAKLEEYRRAGDLAEDTEARVKMVKVEEGWRLL